MLDYIINFLENLAESNEVATYIILGTAAFIDNIFPPLPGELISLFAGFLVAKESLQFTWVLVAINLGNILGFMSFFYIAYHYGASFLEEEKCRLINAKTINRIKSLFSRFGYLIVLVNRFLPGLRSFISPVAGILKYRASKVFIFALFSTAIFNLLILYLGITMGDNWDEIMATYSKYAKIAAIKFGVLALVSTLIFFKVKHIIKVRKRRRERKEREANELANK